MVSFRRIVGLTFALLLLLLPPLSSRSIPSNNEFENSRKAADFVIRSHRISTAAEQYRKKHPEKGLEPVTYGELVREDLLPDTYCLEEVSRSERDFYTCGETAPGLEESKKALGPVIKKDYGRSALVFVFPYRDYSDTVVRTVKHFSDGVDLRFGIYRKYLILYEVFDEETSESDHGDRRK